MKITRRDFLKTTALTSLYFAGFGAPGYTNSGTKKKFSGYHAKRWNGWFMCATYQG